MLKMRAHGKKHYDEERYSQSLKDLRKADKALAEASEVYKMNPTYENGKILDDRDYDVFCAENMASYLRNIMDKKIKDPEMTDTMYELHGYKIKEEGDKFFEQFKQRICGSKGFWVPQR